jgi:hypothetical protein
MNKEGFMEHLVGGKNSGKARKRDRRRIPVRKHGNLCFVDT